MFTQPNSIIYNTMAGIRLIGFANDNYLGNHSDEILTRKQCYIQLDNVYENKPRTGMPVMKKCNMSIVTCTKTLRQ